MSIPAIRGSDFYNYVLCPSKVELGWFGKGIHKDLIPRFALKRRLDGISHEKKVILNFQHHEVGRGLSDIERMKRKTQLCKNTLKLMNLGVEYIFQGVLLDQDGVRLKGTPDLLRKVDHQEGDGYGPSRFGNYHYEVIDIKSSKKVKMPQIAQIGFYSLLLEKIQGIYPKKSYIINIDSEELEVDNLEYRDWVLELLENLKNIALRKENTIGLLCTECNECEFKTYCRDKALERDCVSLLHKIGPVLSHRLIDQGICSLGDVYRATEEELLDVKGIGKGTVKRIKNQVISLKEEQTLVVNVPNLDRDKEVFIWDFEGKFFPYDHYYLTGILRKPKNLNFVDRFFHDRMSKMNTEKQKKEFFKKYHRFYDFRNSWRKRVNQPTIRLLKGEFVEVIQFIAKEIPDEKQMWDDIIRYYTQFQDQDYVIYQYGSYETMVIRKLIQKYGFLFAFMEGIKNERPELMNRDDLVEKIISCKNNKKARNELREILLENEIEMTDAELNKLLKTFSNKQAKIELKIWKSRVDLSKFMGSSIVLPLRSYSLKKVAKKLFDFKWRSIRVEVEMKNDEISNKSDNTSLKEIKIDGASSMVLFDKWLKECDPKDLHDLLDYNVDDLYATLLLVMYLMNLQS